MWLQLLLLSSVQKRPKERAQGSIRLTAGEQQANSSQEASQQPRCSLDKTAGNNAPYKTLGGAMIGQRLGSCAHWPRQLARQANGPHLSPSEVSSKQETGKHHAARPRQGGLRQATERNKLTCMISHGLRIILSDLFSSFIQGLSTVTRFNQLSWTPRHGQERQQTLTRFQKTLSRVRRLCSSTTCILVAGTLRRRPCPRPLGLRSRASRPSCVCASGDFTSPGGTA